jgi:hypothetical protein
MLRLQRAANARLTVLKPLMSLGIATKAAYPNLTSSNPVTEGCEWQNDAACVA